MQYWPILDRPCRSVATVKKGHEKAILRTVFQRVQFQHSSACWKLCSCNCDICNFARTASLFSAFYVIINLFLLLVCLNLVL